MKYVEASQFGGPEVLRVVEKETPRATDGMLVVDVKAAGVNYADVAARMGSFPAVAKAPFLPGFEIAGVVSDAGKGANGFKVGDSVAAITSGGGYASHAVIPAASAVPIPRGLDHSLATSLLVQGLTAYLLLEQAQTKKDDVVLIAAAAGGVGSLAVQLAKARGATVIGLASASKFGLVKSLGADHVFDYGQADCSTKVSDVTRRRESTIAKRLAGEAKKTAQATPNGKSTGGIMARIVRIHEYGDPSVLRIEDIEVPPPASGEVQIEVKSIGLNRAEVMFRTHAYAQEAHFPSRLGYEAAGIVKAIGASVSGFKTGEVVSLVPPPDIARWGTYGEVANVPARNLVKHPENISFEEAAASWMQYVTAWGALVEQAKLTKGDFVIVTAASSSVGIAAFQVARVVGATVIATTRTSAKRQALLANGAHHVIATEEEDLVTRVMEITNGLGARVVFDPVGGPSLERLTQSMSRGATLLEYGALSSEPTTFPLFTVIRKSLTVKGYNYGEIVNDEAALNRAKSFITKGLVSGQLKPLIARVFRLAQIQEATRFLESTAQVGKIVVDV